MLNGQRRAQIIHGRAQQFIEVGWGGGKGRII